MTKKPNRYDGQWLGRLATDDGQAWIVLELEHLIGGNRLGGIAYFYPDRDDIAAGAVEIIMDVGATRYEHQALAVQGVDPRDGSLFPPSEVEKFFPNSGLAQFADVSFDLHPDGRATVSIKTEYLTGDATLMNGQSDPKSKLKARRLSWNRFRAEMFKDGRSEFIYRGQCRPDKLRTTFHRTSRKTLHMYREFAIPDPTATCARDHQRGAGDTRDDPRPAPSGRRENSVDQRPAALFRVGPHGADPRQRATGEGRGWL